MTDDDYQGSDAAIAEDCYVVVSRLSVSAVMFVEKYQRR